jgi:hypothetical protein
VNKHHLQNLKRHARRRVKARFGVKLTRNLRGELLSQMVSGRAKFLGAGGQIGRYRWLVILRGKTAIAVYDEFAREFCTVFESTPKCFSKREVSEITETFE